MKADLDDIAADFWRIYTQKVRDALDTVIAVHKLNFGPGYHGSKGYGSSQFGMMSPLYLFKGSVSEDKSIHYIDIFGIGCPLNSFQTADISDTFRYMRPHIQEAYAETGRPVWHESSWITAEADSAVAHTGTIDVLTATVLTDYGANFNTDNNWNMCYRAQYGMWLLLDPWGTQPEHRVYFRISYADGATEETLTTDLAHGPGINWQWDWTPDMTGFGNPGDEYVIVAHDMFGHGSGWLFIPLTQEERATAYVQFLDDMVNLQGLNGDYIDVGYSNWEFFDYAYRNGAYEHRNFGFATVKGNLYDGVQATRANGEIQDCGDFVTPVSAKLINLYEDILQSNPSPTPPPDAGIDDGSGSDGSGGGGCFVSAFPQIPPSDNDSCADERHSEREPRGFIRSLKGQKW
jgi:hypothetical protein